MANKWFSRPVIATSFTRRRITGLAMHSYTFRRQTNSFSIFSASVSDDNWRLWYLGQAVYSEWTGSEFRFSQFFLVWLGRDWYESYTNCLRCPRDDSVLRGKIIFGIWSLLGNGNFFGFYVWWFILRIGSMIYGKSSANMKCQCWIGYLQISLLFRDWLHFQNQRISKNELNQVGNLWIFDRH